MTSYLVRLVLVVSFLSLVPTVTDAQSSIVAQIKIDSGWGGLGVPQRYQVHIVRKSTGYFAGDKKVDGQLIENLLQALSSPAVPELDLDNLGITQAWLDANAERGVREYADVVYSAAAPNQQALYLSTFKDVAFMKRLLPSLYGGMWTDDYPWVEVDVIKKDGQKLVVRSEAQQLFMLPWEVTNDGRKIKTWNAEISRSVVALLPVKATNRDRLSGARLPSVLADAVLRSIEDKWNLLNVENKVGKYLRELQGSFEVESAEINSYHNVDFGKEWVNGAAGAENLQAVLKRSDLPPGFQIGLVLPYESGEVRGVNTFIGNANHYIDRVLSIPWLKDFIRSNSRMGFELRFVSDRSFSAKAMQIFASDMRLKGKESLVKEVEKVQEGISLLAVGWKYNRDYWLVLPDNRIVLWRFNMYRGPVKWEALKSASWDCSKYQDKCVGAIISPDGSVTEH